MCIQQNDSFGSRRRHQRCYPCTIAGGVPTKDLKRSFTPEMIAELMGVDHSRLDRSAIEQHVDDLYRPLTAASQLAWMPKKDENG